MKGGFRLYWVSNETTLSESMENEVVAKKTCFQKLVMLRIVQKSVLERFSQTFDSTGHHTTNSQSFDLFEMMRP